MYIILVYDIKFDEEGKGQKILPKVFKICKKYLYHIQNSVFEGELTKAEILKLKSELEKVIRKDEDSIIIFKSRHERWLEKDFWGLKEDKTSNFL
ncbi:CRISPR-associated protein Cas2 [Marinitoga sp. 1135]|uniref:CRISPR-associated endonuclease Cas2 n=1 Tax=unclassified Marinitoga TaxID=2640159 RepID=UPI0009507409|nr:CRISPR-associated endonuclease Cas2 [Marinitoga sp. 1135]APT75255.1 CRISPR-associated protein Cas2 [Marinitoga sp. 1137]NUU95033.1 CRISPR-associated protein Cas2 [Marinitoga sp. 1135]